MEDMGIGVTLYSVEWLYRGELGLPEIYLGGKPGGGHHIEGAMLGSGVPGDDVTKFLQCDRNTYV